MKKCENCGSDLNPDFKFCVNCGTPVPKQDNGGQVDKSESEPKVSNTSSEVENKVEQDKVDDKDISNEKTSTAKDVENKIKQDKTVSNETTSSSVENKEENIAPEKTVEDNAANKTPKSGNSKINLKGIFKVSLIVNTISLIVMLILMLIVVSKLINEPNASDIVYILRSEVSIFAFFVYVFWITIAINIIIILYALFGKNAQFFNKVKNKTYLYLIASAVLIVVSFTPFRVILAVKKITSDLFSFNLGGATSSAMRLVEENPQLIGELFVITLIMFIVNTIISIIFFRAVPFKEQDEITLDNIDKEKINQGISASKDAAKKSVEVGSEMAKKGLTTGKEATKKGLATSKEATKKGLNKLNEKRKNMSKKNKVISIIILIVFVVGLGLSVYFTQFKKTNVDILEDIKIEYTGVSGNAKAEINEASIKMTNDFKINDFINNRITYTITPNENLKEGDTITVRIDPDPYYIDEYKIKITNLVKEFKVIGLDKYPDSLSDIKDLKKYVDASLASVTDSIKDELNSSSYYEYKDIKTTYVETCFVKDIEEATYGSKAIKIYNIFKTTYAEKYGSSWENETRFDVSNNEKDVLLNSKGELKEDLSFSIDGYYKDSISKVKSYLPSNAKCEVVK